MQDYIVHYNPTAPLASRLSLCLFVYLYLPAPLRLAVCISKISNLPPLSMISATRCMYLCSLALSLSAAADATPHA